MKKYLIAILLASFLENTTENMLELFSKVD